MAAPIEWIEMIFDRFAAMYGNRLATMWAGSDIGLVKREWAEALGWLSRTELRLGLVSARARDWPPTLGEFLALCRPVPSYEAMFIDAQRGTLDAPIAYWAAQAFGRYELRTATWPKARQRWVDCVDRVTRDHDLPPVPAHDQLALPAPGKTLASAIARAAIDRMKSMTGRRSGMPSKESPGPNKAPSATERSNVQSAIGS